MVVKLRTIWVFKSTKLISNIVVMLLHVITSEDDKMRGQLDSKCLSAIQELVS